MPAAGCPIRRSDLFRVPHTASCSLGAICARPASDVTNGTPRAVMALRFLRLWRLHEAPVHQAGRNAGYQPQGALPQFENHRARVGITSVAPELFVP